MSAESRLSFRWRLQRISWPSPSSQPLTAFPKIPLVSTPPHSFCSHRFVRSSVLGRRLAAPRVHRQWHSVSARLVPVAVFCLPFLPTLSEPLVCCCCCYRQARLFCLQCWLACAVLQLVPVSTERGLAATAAARLEGKAKAKASGCSGRAGALGRLVIGLWTGAQRVHGQGSTALCLC